MASSMMEEVFPVVVESVEKNLKWHWSKSVKQLTENVKTMIEEMDPNLYDKCLEEIAHKEYLAGQEDIKRKENWERLELAAAKNHQFFQPQKCIYVSH
jgi:serine/threonine-protein phosphatase 2A regulatory subunit B'